MSVISRPSLARSARFSATHRAQLRRIALELGRKGAARVLGVSDLMVERASDPHELLYEKSAVRLVAALERFGSKPEK